MIIGVPKEIKDHEYRVALLPSAAYQLTKRGHTVVVERGAGVGAGYPDLEYERAGREAGGLARRRVRAGRPDREGQRAVARRISTCSGPASCCSPTCTSPPSKPLTEALMKSGATVHRLRNHRGKPPPAVARTDERNRRAHERARGRLFSGETFWRQRRAAGRRAGRVARAKWSCSAAVPPASTPRAWPRASART